MGNPRRGTGPARRGRARAVEMHAGALHRRRPHRRPERRPRRAADRLDRTGVRRRRLGRRAGRRPRVRDPRRLAGAAGAPGRGDRADGGHPAETRPAGDRPPAEHQRLDPAEPPGTGRHPDHADPRRAPGRRRGPDHRPSPAGVPVPARAAAGRHGRRGGVGGPGGGGLRAAAHHPRLPVRAGGRASRGADGRRRTRRRRAHRHAPYRVVLVQRPAGRPAARGGALGFTRQRLPWPTRRG
jgi:hypothetical protein